jgi:hypothetical protein
MRQADPAGMLSASATHAELEEDVTP